VRATAALWVAFLVIIVLFVASLVAAYQAGAGVLSRANAPAIPPERIVLDSSDLIIEGCLAPLPSGEQEVRLKLYNTGLTALREMRIEVALDGKPPKAPASPSPSADCRARRLLRLSCCSIKPPAANFPSRWTIAGGC
jgi:hypothetical protein